MAASLDMGRGSLQLCGGPRAEGGDLLGVTADACVFVF